MLKRFLNGITRVSVVEHVTGTVVYDEEVHLGPAPSGSRSSTAEGRPLGIDKSNRIATTFDTRDAEHTAPLLDSTERGAGGAARGRGGGLPGLRHAARRRP